MTLMDLISSDPSSASSSSASSTTPSSTVPLPPTTSTMAAPVPVVVEKKSKRGTLMQIQSDTISAAKAALNPVRMPQKQKKKVHFLF